MEGPAMYFALYSPTVTELCKLAAVETAVTIHDAPTWAYHVADEFVGIGRRYTGKADAKQERVSQIAGSTAQVTLHMEGYRGPG